MIISRVSVSNFRCILDAQVALDPVTVLLGPNGSGKSCFLRAIDQFYNPNAKYDETDFYDKTREIVVTVTFGNLTSEEKDLFKFYVEGDSLTVQKVINWSTGKTSQKYHGMRLRNSDFDAFRNAKGAHLRREYQQILAKYASLAPYSTKEDAEEALRQWEIAHPDQCTRVRDDGQFFGFKEVGEAQLERYTRFILIPAVRDAAQDAAEGRGAAISQIIDLVIRNELAQKREYLELQQDTAKRFKTVLPDLAELNERLTNSIRSYVPDSQIRLVWQGEQGSYFPSPTVLTQLMEDGYFSPVDKTGHGLQRAFVLTMLQQLALAQGTARSEQENKRINAPNLIIGIEEPELYQHPDRQRHFSRVLLELSSRSIPQVAGTIQVAYSTHSPLLVDLGRFESLRMFRKIAGEGDAPKRTSIAQATIKRIVRDFEIARNVPEGTFSAGSLMPHLQVLMTPWFNEGFFARLAMLVEGITDRGAILGIALSMGHDLESRGVSIIPYNGKASLIYASLIFRSLGVPTYILWDSDASSTDGKNIACNRTILRFLGKQEEDFPGIVSDDFTAFKTNLHDVLRAEVGAQTYDKLLSEYLKRLELRDGAKVMENEHIVRDLYNEIKVNKKSSRTMEEIISKVVSKLG